MTHRNGVDDVERRNIFPLPGLELRPFDLPARRQSVYQLRCPCSTRCRWEDNIKIDVREVMACEEVDHVKLVQGKVR
jgi:hypothetical protein